MRRPNLREHRLALLVGSGALGVGLAVLFGMGYEWLALVLLWAFVFLLFWIDV